MKVIFELFLSSVFRFRMKKISGLTASKFSEYHLVAIMGSVQSVMTGFSGETEMREACRKNRGAGCFENTLCFVIKTVIIFPAVSHLSIFLYSEVLHVRQVRFI